MNWLDIALILIIVLSVVEGFAKGLARTSLGFASVLAGLIAGLWFYGTVGMYVRDLVSSRQVANLIGFFVIFLGIVLLGALLGSLLARLFKLVRLSWLDRLLGGGFGAVRGVLVAAVLVMALMAFEPKPPPGSVARSQLAPYVVDAARTIASAAPYEIQQGFRISYERLKDIWTEALKERGRRLPEQEI